MTAPSLRSHLADVIGTWLEGVELDEHALADALLADPTLAAIYDLAAEYADEQWVSPEVRALLKAHRESRGAER